MLVDSAVYADGQRTTATTLVETYRISREPSKFAWVILHQPTLEEFVYAARKFALRELEVEDAIRAHQRPKLEQYADCLFMLFKPAHYVDEAETIEFGQIQVFVGTDFILIVSQGEASMLNNVRKQVEGEPDRLRRGPHAILYEIISEVVESYAPVVEGLEKDID
jgi:magnesium transporter